ncbi:50S ribosomal protein L11 methyltransferase, partial [Brevundimonas sp.]|uniref:class I SAM-dependent methyltransferase n=3 Tax=Brevundimonas TaxID=41275 RepID=UPI00289CA187
VAGKRVLDFAAGSGLVGVAAMKAGAASVLCADIDPFCQAAVAANATANDVTLAFTQTNLLDAPPPEVEVICAGDICYERPMTDAVLAWLALAREKGTRVLIGDPGRTYFPRTGLDFLAEYRVPTSRELEDQEIKRSSVWAMP